MVVAVELDPAAVRQHLLQGRSAGSEAWKTFAAAEEQDLGLDGAELVEGAAQFGHDRALGVDGGSQLAHGDRPGVGLALLLRHHLLRHPAQQAARHHLEERRRHLEAEHARHHRSGHVAAGDLLVEPRQPLAMRRAVGDDRRFVERDLLEVREGAGGLQDDRSPGADAERALGSGCGENGVQVLDLGADAVVRLVRAGEPAAATVREVDGELVGQRLREQRVAAGRLHAAVQDDDGRALSGLVVADLRAVAGGDGALGQFCCSHGSIVTCDLVTLQLVSLSPMVEG